MTLLLNTGWKNEFNDRMRSMIQQTDSKLKKLVNIEPIDSEYHFLDKLGKIAVRKNNDAFAPIQNNQISVERRRLSADRFLFDILLDKNKMRKLVNSSAYQAHIVANMKMAFERKIDKVIIDALNASVYTGKAGTTVVTAADDGVQTIDATAGTTYEKIKEAKRKLAARGWSTSNGYEIFHLITEQELDSYESELEFSSNLYTGNNRVVKDPKSGDILSVLGIQLITFPSDPEQPTIDKPALDVSGGVRNCFLMVGKKQDGQGFPGSVTLGMEKMLEWSIKEDPTRHDTWILKGGMNIGATREHGTAVELFQTTTL